MSDNANREAILRRVQKLLAIAQDARADQNEAAAAAQMAAKIMRKYQIDEGEALLNKLRAGDDLSAAEFVATAKTNGTPVRNIPPWAQWIAVAVANLNDCGVRVGHTQTDKGREACLRFYGYTVDVQVCVWTMEYLTNTVLMLCDKFKSSDQYVLHGRAYLNSYRLGVASGITAALKKALAEKEAANAAQSSGRELVAIKQNAITAKFGDFGYNVSRSRSSSVLAFSQGHADGSRVDVRRRGIGHSGSPAAGMLSQK